MAPTPCIPRSLHSTLAGELGRTEENGLLLILSRRFSLLQRGRSVLASKGVRQNAPPLTHLEPVINAARKDTES